MTRPVTRRVSVLLGDRDRHTRFTGKGQPNVSPRGWDRRTVAPISRAVVNASSISKSLGYRAPPSGAAADGFVP
ncbi:hypothetical protein [Nocardia nova]|uniref:hypothetical protein n=1 Tax=Nocardia nova TaxID=37330 RepID=UPI0033CF6924